MEDKDFDRLFQAQFEYAEMEPSSDLWGSIEKEIMPKRRRVLPIYWMAAAVAVIAVTVGLLIPKTEPIRLNGSGAYIADNITLQTIGAVPIGKETVATTTEVVEDQSTPLIIAPRVTAEDVKKDFIAMQPKATEGHLDVMETKVSTVTEAHVEPIRPVVETLIASADVPVENYTITGTEQAEHRGIRNVGDLVNMVVSKVDKRDKKLIQFTTDDDDNSSLIAINIGFLKFNKRDK